MPNMVGLALGTSRYCIDLKSVHIQGQREIRWHIMITWRLPQKIEIMKDGAVKTVL